MFTSIHPVKKIINNRWLKGEYLIVKYSPSVHLFISPSFAKKVKGKVNTCEQLKEKYSPINTLNLFNKYQMVNR